MQDTLPQTSEKPSINNTVSGTHSRDLKERDLVGAVAMMVYDRGVNVFVYIPN